MRLLLLAPLLFTGCGGDSSGLIPVTGTITIDNEPAANALVEFIPQKDTSGNGGTAQTDASGRFEIKTPQGKRGLPPGEYKVTVSRRLNPDGSQPDPNVPPIESEARETLPSRYTDRDHTELKGTVKADSKTFEFTLRSSKKK